MKNLWSKNTPQAVNIRKWMLSAIVLFVSAIVLMVFLGINSGNPSSKDPKAVPKNAVQRIANESDTETIKSASKNIASTLPQNKKEELQNKPVVVSPDVDPPKASAQDEALAKDISAPITANQITSEISPASQTEQKNGLPVAEQNAKASQDDQNRQLEKKAFLDVNSQINVKDDYLAASLQSPLSPYELQAGAIIPCLLMTGINSDLPGQITGKVRSNVYDSISGNYLLIPQGATLVGLYDSQIAYGQKRVLIAWKRIIFSNGQSIDLQGMPGVDSRGYAGLHDQVDNHYFKMFGSVILMSVLSAGAQLSQPPNQNNNLFNNPTVGQTVAQSLGANITNTATLLTQKNINLQPTLVINPGYLFNVSVTKDMVFPSAYKG